MSPLPPPAPDLLRFERFSTADVAPERRHEAWATRGFPSVSALYSSIPLGPFDTDVSWVKLDGMILQYAVGTPRIITRDARRIAADGVRMLAAGVQFDGPLTGEADGVPFDCPAGAVLLIDMARPSRLALPAGRSYQLALPRLSASGLGDPDALHGRVLPAERVAPLNAYLAQLQTSLPLFEVAQQARIARTVIDLLALAAGETTLPASAQGDGGEPRASAARRAIEVALGSPDLGVTYLCRELGVSRSALYQEFRSEGGVEAYIRARRLEQVRAALLDPDNHSRTDELASRWGFRDGAHLNRQFRATYGAPPKRFRLNALATR